MSDWHSDQCIMLDVDGVLIKGRDINGSFWATDLQKDLGISLDHIRSQFFARIWSDVIIGKINLEPALTEILSKIAPEISTEQFISYWIKIPAASGRGIHCAKT